VPDDGPTVDEEPVIIRETISPQNGGKIAVVDAKPPAEPTRESILAAFARTRTPPSPQPAASPQPVIPQPRPAQRQAAPEPEMGEEAVDELIAGWRVGNLAWPKRSQMSDYAREMPREDMERAGRQRSLGLEM
jgi:hypothetical protein